MLRRAIKNSISEHVFFKIFLGGHAPRPRGPPLHISFDMIRNQATNLSDSVIPKDSSLDSCDSNDSKQDSIDSVRF